MTKPATVRDVARLADVSLGTVSNYLNGRKRIAEGTRARIDAAIRDLEFVPNAAVRVVLGARSPAIAFIVPDGENPFFSDVARGIEDVAVRFGLVVIFCSTGGLVEREEHYARALSEMRIRAAVTVATPTSDTIVSALEASGARVVSLGTSGGPGSSYSVVMNDFRGGYLAVGHLLTLGERELVFFGGPAGVPQIRQRLAGVHEAMREHGLPADRLRRVDATGSTPSARFEAADRVLDAVHGSAAAVFCANDLLALALESAAIRRGVAIPRDLAIIGFDDIEGALTAPVPLSTIRQPRHLLGSAAAALALEELGDPEEVMFEPELVVRASTGGSAN